jgi:hypothetical protein
MTVLSFVVPATRYIVLAFSVSFSNALIVVVVYHKVLSPSCEVEGLRQARASRCDPHAYRQRLPAGIIGREVLQGSLRALRNDTQTHFEL